MEKAEKNSRNLDRLKWFWCVPAALMFAGTQLTFGKVGAFGLAITFGIAFYLICSRASQFIICEDIVKDMRDTLDRMGQRENMFEVKGFGMGLVVRVYMIQAGRRMSECNKAVLEKLDRGWYKSHIWVTQIVDIESEDDVHQAQLVLNKALLDESRNKKDGQGRGDR